MHPEDLFIPVSKEGIGRAQKGLFRGSAQYKIPHPPLFPLSYPQAHTTIVVPAIIHVTPHFRPLPSISAGQLSFETNEQLNDAKRTFSSWSHARGRYGAG